MRSAAHFAYALAHLAAAAICAPQLRAVERSVGAGKRSAVFMSEYFGGAGARPTGGAAPPPPPPLPRLPPLFAPILSDDESGSRNNNNNNNDSKLIIESIDNNNRLENNIKNEQNNNNHDDNNSEISIDNVTPDNDNENKKDNDDNDDALRRPCDRPEVACDLSRPSTSAAGSLFAMERQRQQQRQNQQIIDAQRSIFGHPALARSSAVRPDSNAKPLQVGPEALVSGSGANHISRPCFLSPIQCLLNVSDRKIYNIVELSRLADERRRSAAAAGALATAVVAASILSAQKSSRDDYHNGVSADVVRLADDDNTTANFHIGRATTTTKQYRRHLASEEYGMEPETTAAIATTITPARKLRAKVFMQRYLQSLYDVNEALRAIASDADTASKSALLARLASADTVIDRPQTRITGSFTRFGSSRWRVVDPLESADTTGTTIVTASRDEPHSNAERSDLSYGL